MGQDLGITPSDIFRLTQIVCSLAAENSCSISDAIDRLELSSKDFRGPPDPVDFARTARRFRLSRQRRLGAPLFRDPAWDILLELLVSGAEGRRVSITSLCLGAGVPATTALRHLDLLGQHGFIIRHDDPHDQRRSFAELAPARKECLLNFLAAWCREVVLSPGGHLPARPTGVPPAYRKNPTGKGSTHPVFLS